MKHATGDVVTSIPFGTWRVVSYLGGGIYDLVPLDDAAHADMARRKELRALDPFAATAPMHGRHLRGVDNRGGRS